MTIAPGTRLGPYEIQSALGAGGMGEVYKARDTRLDRMVAIKVLPASLAADPQFRERFDREARAISQLDHPHICALYDVGEERLRPERGAKAPSESERGWGPASREIVTSYLVMQYLEGETLEARLKKGALPITQALTFAIQIAEALDKAHRGGIVHRDLKPGNVMLTKTGAMLLDFGLAKAAGPTGGAAAGRSILPTTPPNLTAQGTILGTFQYMAPEQLEGQDADARSDIFAFGTVVYEMVTGKKAFQGNSQASLIAAILEREPAPVSAVQPLAPSSLDRVVQKCLRKNPDERWQSARDLGDELIWIGGEGAKTGASPTHVRVAAVASRERLAWLLVSAVLIAGAVFAGYTWALRRPAPSQPVVRFDIVTPPSSDPSSFALSPDGRQIVFVALSDGATKLWVRPLDSTTPRPLLDTEGASYPFWSPDAGAIAFFADGKLKRVEASGGTPQVLADAPGGRGGTWNAQGVILFTPSQNAANPTGVITRVSATGGTATPVTRLKSGQGSHRWPQFLPDGRRFIFFSGLGTPETNGVYLGSLDGREPIRLLAADSAALFAPPATLLVVRQGVLRAIPFDPDRGVTTGDGVPVADAVGRDGGTWRSAFSVSQTGELAYRSAGGSQRRQLAWVDRRGTRVGTVGTPDDTSIGCPNLDPAGRRVAVHRAVSGRDDVWLVDLTRGLMTKFTFDPVQSSCPVWSADGTQVFYISTRNGTADIFQKPATGARDEQLLLRDAGFPLSVSGDGRFLLYGRDDIKTLGDIWALPLTGDRKPFPVAQTKAHESGGVFSPDGRWMAYESDESGRSEIYVRSFPAAGARWQLSTAGGAQPQWKRDGKELYYVAPDARMMAVTTIVSADGQTVEAGSPVPLFPTRLASGANVIKGKPEYVVAPDGRFLMNVVVDEANAAPISVVLNWPAQLKP